MPEARAVRDGAGLSRAPVRAKLSLAVALLSSQSRNVGIFHGEEEGFPQLGGRKEYH